FTHASRAKKASTEDRLNRKQVGSLTRKPGSDHNLFERKAASFLYSPGRLSEHLYEDRFANEGSSSRVSDYSLSSGGDPFKSAPQSPNLQTDDGFSSPTSDSSREIVDGLNRTYSETFAKRDIPLPRPQRTMSSVSVGSFEKNSASLPSIDSGSSFDAFPEPNHSNATTQNKVSTILSPSQLPVESVGGLNFFEDASGMPAPNSALSFDLFQASRVESVASVDLFQFPADSSALSKKFPQTSCSSSSSFLPQTSQNPTVPNLHQKLPESSEPSNEGWATFDAPQHGDIPGTNTVDTVGSEAGSEGGITLSNLNYVPSSNAGLQWPEFQSSSTQSPPFLVSNPLKGLQTVHEPANMPSSQVWKAFDEGNVQQPHSIDMQGLNSQVSFDNTSSSTDLFFGLKTSQDSSIDGLQQIAPTEGFSFPILPSFVEPMHPFMSDEASARQNSVNPFDVPFDSELEAHNSFLDMSTLQAALPNKSLPPSYMSSINEPWFPGNSVASPGGISYMTVQAPSSQLQSKRTGTPVPNDPDLEKTIRLLKKTQKKKKQSVNKGKHTEEPTEPIMPHKSLKSYGVPSPGNIPTGPTMLDIQAVNFEIKPALINMIQQNQFGEHPSEDPANHLQWFQQLCRTVKHQGVDQ
ncbi:probable ADP-ribosylation factor GTPase-activating protein AGD14, partial [Beta vulgaris subsp. vulgaris]